MTVRLALFNTLATVLLLAWCAASPVSAAQRQGIALLVGVSNSEYSGTLASPEADVELLQGAFQKAGYSVTRLLNPTSANLVSALDDFALEAKREKKAVIYFAGHGLQLNGQPVLVPADDLAGSELAIQKVVPVQRLVDSVQGAGSLRLVLVDACRSNKATGQQPLASTALPAGAGTLVIFSAASGALAEDGGTQPSRFARSIGAELDRDSGQDAGEFARRVTEAVRSDSKGTQQPFTYGSLGKNAQPIGKPGAPKTPPPTAEQLFDRMEMSEVLDLARAGDRKAALYSAWVGMVDPDELDDAMQPYLDDPTGEFQAALARFHIMYCRGRIPSACRKAYDYLNRSLALGSAEGYAVAINFAYFGNDYSETYNAGVDFPKAQRFLGCAIAHPSPSARVRRDIDDFLDRGLEPIRGSLRQCRMY